MTNAEKTIQGPHAGQPIMATGTPLDSASAAMIMVHGRGSTPEDILSLAAFFDAPNFAYLAPRAAGNTWYPHRFMEPLEKNEPYLSSALAVLDSLMVLLDNAGIAPEKTIVLGFSQGACLSLEFAARHAQRYGGVIALSGALIGPDGTPRNYAGSLEHTPVFLGCSDVDFHIPKQNVLNSGEVMSSLGGDVTTRIYPNMGHTTNKDEIAVVRDMMTALVR
ncbi:MAG: phospholipase [Chloroflexota bacterium]